MKRFAVAILALLYMSSSVGASVQAHYCMGKLADWGLGHSKSETCAKCGMVKYPKDDNGCCKDELKFIKNDADQKTTEAAFQISHPQEVALRGSFIKIPSNYFTFVTEENPTSHAPPHSVGVAVHIRNCVFRI